MRIFLPFNSVYFKNRYDKCNSLTSKVVEKVIPGLVTRLSMNDQVSRVDLFSDVDFSNLVGISSKLRCIQNAKYSGESFYDLINSYLDVIVSFEENLIYYNPLFPFISINNLKILYQRVIDDPSKVFNASYMPIEVKNNEIEESVFVGAMSIFNIKNFQNNGHRKTDLSEHVPLSALELISMRSDRDLRLYELITNSGFEI